MALSYKTFLYFFLGITLLILAVWLLNKIRRGAGWFFSGIHHFLGRYKYNSGYEITVTAYNYGDQLR